MKTLKEKIEVMQAALDGKEIQILICDGWDDWDNDTLPAFNWGANDYRIKPEPMEFWVNVYDDGIKILISHEANIDNYEKDGLVKTIKVREVIE